MATERLYLVTYDIADPKRWKYVFKMMKGYGRWLQRSTKAGALTPATPLIWQEWVKNGKNWRRDWSGWPMIPKTPASSSGLGRLPAPDRGTGSLE